MWIPPKGKDAALETYIRKVRTDVEHQLNRQAKIPHDNFSSAERTALKNLRQQNDIKCIIKPADKGSTVVVLSRQDYIHEANRPLNNTTYYQQLTAEPTPQHTSEVTNFMSSVFTRGLINKKKLNNF